MQKPRLSFWQIWNMSFGFLGIQFGWTLQMNNMSAIYEYLGAQPSQLPLLWLAAPLTGLLVQPIIGLWSDNTWGPLGRRRPFFLAGAILSSIALIFMPTVGSIWMAAGLLWILDASINVSMEPFRAFVADMLPDEQLARGFTMQGFFIGVGSVAASCLPLALSYWMPQTASAGQAIPQIVRISFWVGALAFIGAVLVTICTTREYPPSAQEAERLGHTKRFDVGEIFAAIRTMPPTMRQLAVVQLITWLGLFCIFLYFAVAVAHNIFGAKTTADPAYTQGVIWASLCSGIYNAVCALVSPILPSVAARVGRRGTHSLCLVAGAIGLLSVALIHDKWLLFLPMIGVGDCMGEYLVDALFDPLGGHSVEPHGHLHGRFQLLHCHSRDLISALLRPRHVGSFREQPDDGHRYGRCLLSGRSCTHATRPRSHGRRSVPRRFDGWICQSGSPPRGHHTRLTLFSKAFLYFRPSSQTRTALNRSVRRLRFFG